MNNQIKKIANFGSNESIKMPVFIGEYGAIDKNNNTHRGMYFKYLNIYAKQNNMVTAYWDNGFTGQYGFALFDRTTNTVTDTGNTLVKNIIFNI